MTERQQRTVLVVDRCRTDRTLSRQLLESAGYRVVLARSSAEGIDLARGLPIELIVLGATSGETAACDLRILRGPTQLHELPILLAGVGLSSDEVSTALDGGADEYVGKPFNRQEFLLRTGFALGVRRSQRLARQSRAALTHEVDTIQILHRFYEEIRAHDAVEPTCERSAQTAGELMDSDRVSVLLTDTQDNSMHFAHAIGMEGFPWHEARVPLSSPVAGRVLAMRREMVVNEGTIWPQRSGYHSGRFVSMPLLCSNGPAGESAIGVLNVTERRRSGDYAPQDVLALRQLARAAAFAIDAVRTRRKLDTTRDSIILSLARLSEYRHASTGKHLERVRELSLTLARELMNDPRIQPAIDALFLADLGRAAPLHDVGKVAIPDRILLKETRLTPEEFALIQDHTRIGAATLQSVMAAGHDVSFLKMAMEIAHGHHERYDGTGYPRGLAGEQIPLSARIVSVADSYDAIRMAREYKAAQPHDEAVRRLKAESGRQYDPRVVDAFCARAAEFERIHDQLVEDGRPAPFRAAAEAASGPRT